MSIPQYLITKDLSHSPAAYPGVTPDPEGHGLTGLPTEPLAEDTILILDDRVPWTSRDPEPILRDLADFLKKGKPRGVLLDLERAPEKESLALASGISQCCAALSIPIAMPDGYRTFSEDLPFLPAPAWWETSQKAPCWMEARPRACDLILSPEKPLLTETEPQPQAGDFYCEALGCRYHSRREGDRVIVHLYDTPKTLEARMEKAGAVLAVYLPEAD